jgi:hypothetical protein
MQTIKLSDEIINDAKKYAGIYNRSLPKQIEYWAKIGKISEENPDLSHNFIKDILMAISEKENGEVSEYKFS